MGLSVCRTRFSSVGNSKEEGLPNAAPKRSASNAHDEFSGTFPPQEAVPGAFLKGLSDTWTGSPFPGLPRELKPSLLWLTNVTCEAPWHGLLI